MLEIKTVKPVLLSAFLLLLLEDVDGFLSTFDDNCLERFDDEDVNVACFLDFELSLLLLLLVDDEAVDFLWVMLVLLLLVVALLSAEVVDRLSELLLLLTRELFSPSKNKR